MLDFKKIADILAPLPGKTALLIKDKTGVLYAGPLAGEEFKSASLIKLAVACYYQAHPQDLSQMVHVPEDKIVEGGMLCHLGRYLMEVTDRENYLSAETALELLERLLADPSPFGQVCQKALFYQESVNKLLQDLPEGCSYSKTGELEDTEHDAARIFSGDSYYDICFMSHYTGLEEREQILLAQNAVGKLAYQNLTGK